MAEILVIGREAFDALDYALAGKISAVAIGQAKYSLLLNKGGGIIDDLVVYRTGEDRFLVVANAYNREVYDFSDDMALIASRGPKSYEILSQVAGVTVPGLEELKYYWCTPGTYRLSESLTDQHELLVARTGYTGEDGFELYVAPDVAPILWDALLETGGGSGLVPAGLASRDTLRLQAGMAPFGHALGLG